MSPRSVSKHPKPEVGRSAQAAEQTRQRADDRGHGDAHRTWSPCQSTRAAGHACGRISNEQHLSAGLTLDYRRRAYGLAVPTYSKCIGSGMRNVPPQTNPWRVNASMTRWSMCP